MKTAWTVATVLAVLLLLAIMVSIPLQHLIALTILFFVFKGTVSANCKATKRS